MSILSMVQRIAADAGFQQPTYVVGNPDEIAIQLLQQIDRETRRLSDEFFWQKLVKIYNFNFMNNVNSYALPSDFNFILPNTIWNQSARQPIICPLTPEDYQLQLNYLVTSAYYKMVYVYDNLMWVTPIPSTGETINLGNNPIQTFAGLTTITLTVPNTGIFNTSDIFTLVGATAVGGFTTDQLNGPLQVVTIINNVTMQVQILGLAATANAVGGGAAVELITGDNINYQYCSNNIYKSALGVGQPGILADSDTTVIKEFIVELGAKLRFLVAKGLISPAEMEASFEKKDYDFQIKRQMMIDGVGQKTLHMQTGGTAYWLAAYTQDSNWPQV